MSGKTTFRFLELAPELRNNVYRQAVVTKKPIDVMACHGWPSRRTSEREELTSLVGSLGLTCKQVRTEMLSIFWSENEFEYGRIDKLHDGVERWLGGCRVVDIEIGMDKPQPHRFLSITPEIMHLRCISFLLHYHADIDPRREVQGFGQVTVCWSPKNNDLAIDYEAQTVRWAHGRSSQFKMTDTGVSIWQDRCLCLFQNILASCQEGRLDMPYNNPLLGLLVAMGTDMDHVRIRQTIGRREKSWPRCPDCNKFLSEQRRTNTHGEHLPVAQGPSTPDLSYMQQI